MAKQKIDATEEQKKLIDEAVKLVEPSAIDNIVMRPALQAEPLIANATATDAIADGLKKIKEVGRITFTRKNREQQKNLTKYFYGLLPITKRKTIHVCGTVTLAMFTGISKELSSGDVANVRDIGSIGELDDDQLEEAIKKIMRMGVKFNYPGDYAKVFKIDEADPSTHYWAHGEYPLGQFCYFESVADLNKKYANESGWRNKMTPMRPLIARQEIPHGYKGVITEEFGDGWTDHWPIRPKRQDEIDVKV